MDHRKTLAEGVVLSRLHQHLKVISKGRRADLARLQRIQNRGMTAARATIMTAMKVVYEGDNKTQWRSWRDKIDEELCE